MKLTLKAEIPGIKAGCEVGATIGSGAWWEAPSKFGFENPSFEIKLKCEACADTWFGDICKSFTIFELKVECSSSGCRRARALRDQYSLSLTDGSLLPLYQDPVFATATFSSLIITGLRPVASVSFVSIPYVFYFSFLLFFFSYSSA